MEERVTSPTCTNNPNPNPHPEIVQFQGQQREPVFRPGTYVVQVPKDLIYRVPPPENALIAERHRNTHQGNNNDNRWCCSRLWTWLLVIVIIVLLLGIIAGIVYIYLIKRLILASLGTGIRVA
ncbi:hypothetical protein DITRI_Ditri05aG0131300 [Diplodiscus trichospermus]